MTRTMARAISGTMTRTVTGPATTLDLGPTTSSRPTSAFSQRVVQRAARRLDRPRRGPKRGSGPGDGTASSRGSTRRSFLARSAMVGSALAVAPARFLLRPGSAYAAITDVCGPDANCLSGGFSVFCCTINGGVNQCPPGSIPGGWWRAGTGSNWCCGADRYIIDCQASCPIGCGCGSNHLCPDCQACSSGCYNGPSCDQRNVCRIRFRYGQCNQQIGCTGNVLCRMVSCTPPWQIPGLNCASGPDKTDPQTADHGAPCLQQASWTGGAFPIAPELILESPAVAQAPGSSRVDIFVRGTDQQVYWNTNDGGGWSGWRWLGTPPGGYFASPAAVSWGPGNLNVFVWGRDNKLWQRFSGDGGQSWSAWSKPLGNEGVLASAPAVCSWGPGRVDVFVIGTDGAVYHRWFDNGWNTSGWEFRDRPPAPIQFSALSATAWGPGRVDVFATAGNRLWQTFYDRGWSGWGQPPNSESGTLVSAPSSTSWGPDHLAVFVRGTDSGLFWTNWYKDYWSGWARVGIPTDTFTGMPAAGSGGCQQINVFARGQAGHVRDYVYSG
ncbi:MAG: hypothetical protein M3083_21045 [Actinomycetota bacterium]|nr:hypothetical protein [Actinomycetota bacterium]